MLSFKNEMTIANWLLKTMKQLGDAGVDSPRRDALVLLEDTLKKERSWVLAHHDFELNLTTVKEVDRLINQRIDRIPLAYIRKRAWFYGRFFGVDENVLIPRPESEDIIEIAKTLGIKSALDMGTGSGCLAITIALEMPSLQIIHASDISAKALDIARLNSENYSTGVKFFNADLYSGEISENQYDLIMANLPYVPDGLVSSPEIKTEPALALFAGLDGLDLYRRFWAQILEAENQPKYVVCESLESQHKTMTRLAKASGYHIAQTTRLAQLFMAK